MYCTVDYSNINIICTSMNMIRTDERRAFGVSRTRRVARVTYERNDDDDEKDERDEATDGRHDQNDRVELLPQKAAVGPAADVDRTDACGTRERRVREELLAECRCGTLLQKMKYKFENGNINFDSQNIIN